MSQTNSDNINVKSEEISLKEIVLIIQQWWRFLFSSWKIILIAGILGGILGLTYSYLKKTIYKADLTFALEDDKSSGGGLGAASGLASQFGFDLGGSTGGVFAGDNLIALLKSRSMVETALLTPVVINNKSQTLAELYISFNNIRQEWQSNPKLKNIRFLNTDRSKFSLQQDSVLGVFYHNIIKNNLSVEKVDKKLSIITINVHSENELFSKFFADVLVTTVSASYVDTKTKRSVQNVNILQFQYDSVRRALNAAITGAASSADANPNANPAMQILRTSSQRHQVDVTANTAILTELVKNLEISKVSLRKETPLVQIIDHPILPLDRERTGKGKGIIYGGLLFGFLAVIILTIKLIYKRILLNE